MGSAAEAHKDDTAMGTLDSGLNCNSKALFLSFGCWLCWQRYWDSIIKDSNDSSWDVLFVSSDI
jgi:ABC-type nickel/cobalt efflux system permease component RcnA